VIKIDKSFLSSREREKLRKKRVKGTLFGLATGYKILKKSLANRPKTSGQNPYLISPPQDFQRETRFSVTKNRPVMEEFRSPIETAETKDQDLLDIGGKKARRLLGIEE
jgi:hypothetical protein